MKLKFHYLSYFSFFPRNLNYNSSIFKIIKIFIIAFLLSNSIYFSFFENIFLDTISPFLSIYGLVLLLRAPKKWWFYIGFLTGLFYFWWVGLSAIYFDLAYLTPVIAILVAFVYGVLFKIAHLFKFDLLRLSAIFLLSYIHPLGFDWLNWGILSVPGFFEPSLKGTICIFLIAYFYYEKYISRYYKMAIILAIFAVGFHYEQKPYESLSLDYKLINTDILQDQKYLKENIVSNSDAILEEVLKAIKEKKQLVVLPESAFAFDLNSGFKGVYKEALEELSRQITIIVGAFNTQGAKTYNSTYIFISGQSYVLNKHYLVPFGEEIPFFKDFFKDFLPVDEFAKGPALSQYKLNNQNITNAICYEATKEALYKDSKIIIAISNNAWFNNSSEYLLQKQLIKYYASKYGVSVYHAVNGKENALIVPKEVLYQKWQKIFEELVAKFRG